MDEQRQDNQLGPIYNSSGPIQDVTWKTSWERWTTETGGERGSERSMLAARHDDEEFKLFFSKMLKKMLIYQCCFKLSSFWPYY